jgi:hypothetical protein
MKFILKIYKSSIFKKKDTFVPEKIEQWQI